MITLHRILGLSLILASAITLSGCKHHYKGYYRNYWRIPSHSRSSSTVRNTANVSQPTYRPDPFYAQQNAAREANLRAVQQQQYRNDMSNYQRGYSNKLPNY